MYELDDETVRRWVHVDASDAARAVAGRALVEVLREQLSLPVPTKYGAVIRTDKGFMVHGHPGNQLCWLGVPENETTSGDWYVVEEIGRITEILFEGVDL